MKYLAKLPEEIIKEKYYKGEITYQEAVKQLKFLINNLKPKEVEKDED